MYGSLNISTSALVANRTWLDAISANIAGKDVLLNEAGEYEPFQRRVVAMAAGDPASDSSDGVHIASVTLDRSPPRLEYDPSSPFANEQGYVGYPNINIVTEQMNAMIAARAYEANIAVAEATKSMISVALQMLA
jgi:flagellar basal-body rod protein FlgC